MALREIDSLERLLEEAIKLNASDIHLAVGARPRCRVYGELVDMDYARITDKNAEKLLLPLLDALARTRLNTDGQWDFSYQIHEGQQLDNGRVLSESARFRVNIFKQKGALAGVFRILNTVVPDSTKLGLPYSIFNLYHKRRGLILVTGPTGSGKSTTLASFIDIINKNMRKHIITLENPIEYLHWHARSNICQREVGLDVDSFQNGLRAALREDPDVILVGEMRDLETTDIALTSAETGHLVCSTLHTLGAADTINRIIDMYPERQQTQVRSMLISVLEAVISQQLLPRADGRGYVVAFEVMLKDKVIQKLIRENKVDEISEYMHSDEAKQEGMYTMDDTILDLYKSEKITKETALDYAFDRKGILPKLQEVKG